ncbi:hypothetical protein AB0M36_02985 [Actinoplanes sp. NPDC051346]
MVVVFDYTVLERPVGGPKTMHSQLLFDRQEWAAFLGGVKVGEFDL